MLMLMLIKTSDVVAGELPTQHYQKDTVATARPKNLVIILEESQGAEFVGSLGGLDLTPNLDGFSSEGF